MMSILTRKVGTHLLVYFLIIYVSFSGKLLRIGELFPRTLEQVMINYGLPEQDAASAAVFIRACLQLNAEERLTAVDLLDHPWLEMAYLCS